MFMRPTLIMAGLAAGLSSSSAAPAQSHHAWAQASSIGRDALVAVALGLPVVQRDWKGLGQSGLSLGVGFGTSELLKRAVHEGRPDRSNDRSFPSGHTSVSFAAAATLEKRYGWQVGLPAQALAAFVGVARVQARKHYWHDVLAGAAIGEASGWLLSSRKDSGVHWLPWGDAHGGGATVAARF